MYTPSSLPQTFWLIVDQLNIRFRKYERSFSDVQVSDNGQIHPLPCPLLRCTMQ
jgi:hypothetical protein